MENNPWLCENVEFISSVEKDISQAKQVSEISQSTREMDHTFPSTHVCYSVYFIIVNIATVENKFDDGMFTSLT